MEQLTNWINTVNGVVWGPPMLVLILGTGFFLMLGLRLMPLMKLGLGFRMVWQGRRQQGAGDITPYHALMTVLSATVGTGNIAGVATAVFLGGPGAIFWMWCTALVGMATKYAEAVLAMHYREVDGRGNHLGGPMYYIKLGLGKKWLWMATAFALFGVLAGFGIGNTVQANSVAQAALTSFGIPLWISGLVMSIFAGLVLLGGIQRIGVVSAALVPFMAILYVSGGLVVLTMHIDQIIPALQLIIHQAFSPTAAVGGFTGASIAAAIQFGVARGIFSNEAGLGSAPIAHAAAQSNDPVAQGTVAMIGTFIDTLVICTITGLVIIVSGEWTSGLTGAALSTSAFEHSLPGVGGYIVAIGLVLFAYTTILGWSVYGERCAEYLFGERVIVPFRVLWVLMIPVGALAQLDLIWLIADTLNALMALPNLVALLLLSPVVFRLTREYFTIK
ncbi:sodium:alanine symporter family protein [Rhodoferax sp. 4810]|uniref:Sodium:alanine symporter family protein n=1 Tax=Thiospirillum jenense TaxID=1653858 RepID=A0A839HIH6_9GAMM|nr:sodium:alanine symporter family protein [Thiospirillum jenense]MBB1075487.1 sodium:alanine symporter family protein [Rhodoferax jenense]MBB1126866.1 sodium:alanine symporter family protein [Thiospirillum jenense]